MSISANASGVELVEQLRAVGYEQIARSDGHFVLETDRNGAHRIVLPDRDRLCEHTVRSIMQDAGSHVGRESSDTWEGAKPPPGGGSVVIYREGVGQVRAVV
jgi:predicted RNA binding protein YcfA (HicA-like mRNA interferase family)